MAEEKEIRNHQQQEQPQRPQEYLHCLHQRIAARLIKIPKTDEAKEKLLKLATS